MPFNWQKFQDGARFKFVKPGDGVEGEVVKIGTTTFGGMGEETPTIDIKRKDGTVVQVTASQVVLCSKLAQAAPEIGDTIFIIYTGDDTANQKSGRSAAKLFDVTVKRAGQPAAVAAAAADDDDDAF